MDPNEIRIYQIALWEEFGQILRSKISAFSKLAGGTDTIYRGQACVSWPLSSQLERSLYEHIPVGGNYKVQRKPDVEKCIIEHFRKFVTGMPGIQTDTISDNELEALGRHHGLCSALLDWTHSPYVACYFAYMAAFEQANHGIRTGHNKDKLILPSEDIAIWGLTLSDKVMSGGYLTIDEWRKDVFYRQRAQQGVFTRLTSPIFIDIENYLKNIGAAFYLCRIEIAGSEAAKALIDVDAMNINESSLFPDLHGAAMRAILQLNWAGLTNLLSVKK